MSIILITVNPIRHNRPKTLHAVEWKTRREDGQVEDFSVFLANLDEAKAVQAELKRMAATLK